MIEISKNLLKTGCEFQFLDVIGINQLANAFAL